MKIAISLQATKMVGVAKFTHALLTDMLVCPSFRIPKLSIYVHCFYIYRKLLVLYSILVYGIHFEICVLIGGCGV